MALHVTGHMIRAKRAKRKHDEGLIIFSCAFDIEPSLDGLCKSLHIDVDIAIMKEKIMTKYVSTRRNLMP